MANPYSLRQQCSCPRLRSCRGPAGLQPSGLPPRVAPRPFQHRLALARGTSRQRRRRLLRRGLGNPGRAGPRYSFFSSRPLFASMNARRSSVRPSSVSHCSTYNVTGKRPIPYTDTRPFSDTLNEMPTDLFVAFSSASFSARSPAITAAGIAERSGWCAVSRVPAHRVKPASGYGDCVNHGPPSAASPRPRHQAPTSPRMWARAFARGFRR